MQLLAPEGLTSLLGGAALNVGTADAEDELSHRDPLLCTTYKRGLSAVCRDRAGISLPCPGLHCPGLLLIASWAALL